MAAVIKEIIAAFKTTGVSQFQGAAKQAEGAVSGIHGAATKATNAIGNLMRNGAQLSGITALLSGVGAGMLAKGAIDATANFERMTATLTALTGSAEKAKGTMSWLEGFGATSVFEQLPLQTATTRLEAFGLTATKWLPTISNLAAAFGTDGNNLIELSDALGRLKAGQSGEALEALRRFGIGSDTLKAKGITFDNGGQMKSDAVTALNAIEQIIKEKFGKINDIMGGTLAVKMSNLGDSWQRILRLTGDVFSPALKTLIDGLGETMNRLATSGVVTQIAQGFASLLNTEKIIAGIRTGVSWMLAGLEALPGMFKQLAGLFQDFGKSSYYLFGKLTEEKTWTTIGYWIGQGMKEKVAPAILTAYRTGISIPVNTWLANAVNPDDPNRLLDKNPLDPITNWLEKEARISAKKFNLPMEGFWIEDHLLNPIGKWFGNIGSNIGSYIPKQISNPTYALDKWFYNSFKSGADASKKAVADSLKARSLDLLGPDFQNQRDRLSSIKNLWDGMGTSQQSFLAKMMGGGGVTNASGTNPADPQKPVGLLGQIASNTSKTAENTQKQIQDLRKFVVGGGSLGDAGVTPVAMFGSRRGTGFTINQGRIHSAAEEFVRYVAQDVMQQQMKLGSRWASG